MSKYVVSSDEYYYIHKVVLLCNEFYDDLISIHHEDIHKEHPEDTVMRLFRVPQGDIIQLNRLVNGEREGSWYE